MKTSYTERAKAELERSTAWYEIQLKGLGRTFIDAVETANRLITRKPL